MRYAIVVSVFLITSFPLKGQHYEFSSGLYRIGYEDDVIVHVQSDVYTHDPLGKYDIVTDADDPYIVAAASGWIRWIVDSYYQSCYVVDQNGDVDCCWEMNNYVIIEHPNGEWSQYTHIAQWSATDLGLEVGDWVTVGSPLGIEGSVGCSTQDHLHFELSRPFDSVHPFDTIGGFLNDLGEMLIPVICGIAPHDPWLTHGDVLLAEPCGDNCPASVAVNITVGSGDQYIAHADNTITTDDVVFSNGSTTQFRAGDYITLSPGFHAQAGTKFAAILRDCNAQN